MSNQITSLKNKKKRANDPMKDPKVMAQLAQAQKGGGKQQLDMSVRKLPETIYINIKTREIKIGSELHTMAEILPSMTIAKDESNMLEVVEFIESIDPSTIKKVLMDNVTDFKIFSHQEIIDSFRANIAKRDSDDIKARPANIQ